MTALAFGDAWQGIAMVSVTRLRRDGYRQQAAPHPIRNLICDSKPDRHPGLT
ncbi:MAG TPA: hypothetical protein VF797_14240 [Noviherbaspirillum sp.]